MGNVLHYAPSTSSSDRRRGRRVLGWILFVICFALSAHITALSIDILWSRRHPAQGLESGMIAQALIGLLAPIEGVIAAACGWGCRRLRVGWRVSAIAMAVAVIAWLCAIVSLLWP